MTYNRIRIIDSNSEDIRIVATATSGDETAVETSIIR